MCVCLDGEGYDSGSAHGVAQASRRLEIGISRLRLEDDGKVRGQAE